MDNDIKNRTTVSQIECKTENDEIKDYQPLKKHSYPFLIKIFMGSVLVVFVFSSLSFFINDFPVHFKMHKQIQLAEDAYKKDDHITTFGVYSEIIEEYPKYLEGRIRLVQVLFKLIPSDEKYYECGLYYLDKVKLTNEQINSLRNCLPESLKTAFIKLFEK